METEESVVALVNLRSGGRRAAEYVYDKLRDRVGEERVFSLFSGPDASRYVSDAKRFLSFHRHADIVIVAGGDGTISFVMDVIKELHDEHVLEGAKGVVAPFPLGTGNDLSYTLGYGGGFARWFVLGQPRFRNMMRLFKKSKVIQLDRWHLVVTENPSSRHKGSSDGSVLATKVMNNYFSVGFDAAIARRLDDCRRRHPQYFLTRPMVKLWYAYFALLSLWTEEPLLGTVTVTLDGKPLSYPANTKALVVTNMITYAGGSILWGPNNKTERSLYHSPSLADGKVEVAALSGVWHLALIRLGLCYATKLGQGERVEVISCRTNHHQYDGESIVLPPSDSAKDSQSTTDSLHFDIRYYCNSDVLQAHLPRRHVLSNFLTTLAVLVVFAAVAHLSPVLSALVSSLGFSVITAPDSTARVT